MLGFSAVGYPNAAAAQSDRIRTTQEELHARGFDPGPTDGIMGAKTRHALMQFQQRMDIPATGKPDQATISALESQREAKRPVASSSDDASTVRAKVPDRATEERSLLSRPQVEGRGDGDKQESKESLPGTQAAAVNFTPPAATPSSVQQWQDGYAWAVGAMLAIGLLVLWQRRGRSSTSSVVETNEPGNVRLSGILCMRP